MMTAEHVRLARDQLLEAQHREGLDDGTSAAAQLIEGAIALLTMVLRQAGIEP